MFFATYLRRELGRRARQSLAVAAGLALGIGLVITVSALASGVAIAQGRVLKALYGLGTDITVMTPTVADGPGAHGQVVPQPEVQHLDTLQSTTSGPIPASQVRNVARLHGVAAAAGGLVLTDIKSTIPGEGSFPPPSFQFPTQVAVTGVDLDHPDLGPFSTGRIVSGRNLSTSDSETNDAVVDSGYASTQRLGLGSVVTLANTPFTVVGIVNEAHDSSPPDVYIPLGRAQALSQLTGYVNTIYVRAASASKVSAVSNEIPAVIPSAKVTNSSSLADEVTGSLAATGSLANTLGVWLAILVLSAAFALASLLTMTSVSRRAREFGTLKALGWRSRRIVGQVIAESIVIGIAGAGLGILLGFGATALASRAAPTLSATVETTDIGQSSFGGGLGVNGGLFHGTVGGAVETVANPNATHTVAIPFQAPVTLDVIVLAVTLAIAGGILAGAFGGWRAARLRPAEALRRIG